MAKQSKIRFSKSSAIAPLVFAFGLALVAVSWLLPVMVDGSALWSNDQAAQYQQASRELHGLSHEHVHMLEAGQRSIEFERRLADAKANYKSLRKKLDQARSGLQWAAWIMRSAGFALAAVGGMLVLAKRSNP